ncbi:MAG TPA: TetR/AcrR family transcriptional regulator [Casimicrobiaceae bacterium]|nr:TetR/AcrR family transcriptional regulator [Casimicrobiaceae bacterium]
MMNKTSTIASARHRKTAARRARSPGRPDAAVLDRATILREALALIDARGVDAFNMRDLAKALGVAPGAVYWHVASRVELVSGVVALAMNDFARIDAGDRWQVRLRAILRQFRTLLRRHPGVAPLVANQLVTNLDVDRRRLDQIVAVLEDARFSGGGLVDAYNVVVAAMCGFATLELSSMPADDVDDWQAACRRAIDAIDSARFPSLGRHVPALRNNAFMLRWSSGIDKPLDSSFEAWLDVIVGGLEQRAAASVTSKRRSRRADAT